MLKTERRKFPRYTFVAQIEIVDMEPPNIRLKARTHDLSRQGVYVDTASPFDVGAIVRVTIQKNDKKFVSAATVLYSIAGNGMGLQFLTVSHEHDATLQRWLKEASSEVREALCLDHADPKGFFDQLRKVLDGVFTDAEKGMAKNLFKK
ncbi:MAG: PilZ domain-containing protein [Acidobacteria bacterium]|nr:PilZ domain-containing protein [Acidobacteriota bacterium]